MVTLKHRLRALAPGLTPRAVLEKLSAMHMVDVHLPTTDGRHIVLPRYTQPEKDQRLLLQTLKLKLPPQPPPRIGVAPVSWTVTELRNVGGFGASFRSRWVTDSRLRNACVEDCTILR